MRARTAEERMLLAGSDSTVCPEYYAFKVPDCVAIFCCVSPNIARKSKFSLKNASAELASDALDSSSGVPGFCELVFIIIVVLFFFY